MCFNTLFLIVLFVYLTTLMASVGIKKRQEEAHYFGNKGKPRKIYHDQV